MANIRDVAVNIKELITMRQVCEMYGFRINHAGNALCPFHNDRNASMHVYPGNRGFHCFSCGAGGSVIDFVMKLFGLPFADAVKRINNDFALGYDLDNSQPTQTDKEAQERARRLRKERAERSRRIEQAEAAYDSALTEWIRLDNIVRTRRPTSMSAMDPEWTNAVVSLAAAEDALNRAELDLAEAERIK